MKWFFQYLGSSVGRKQIMGLTGIGLYSFLFIHMAGNFGLLAGAERFNQYSHLLLDTLGEIIVPIEFLLLAMFLLHSWAGITVTIANKAARPQKYLGHSPSRAKTIFSATMAISGIWLFLFLLIHVPHFRLGVLAHHHVAVYNGVEMHDLYTTVLESFQYIWYTAFYVISMLVVGFHLAHGVQSSFQTLGLNHPKYMPLVKGLSYAYACIISAGFIFVAVWAYLQHGGKV